MITHAISLTTLLICANLTNAESSPNFSSYPVETIIDNEQVNFSGAYQIKYASCGSSGCITAEIFDHVSNKIIGYYPDAYIMVDNDKRKEFFDEYKKGSNLLIIQGVSSIDLIFRRSYYLLDESKLEGKQLILLKEEFPIPHNQN